MIETVKIIETVLGDMKKFSGVEACAVASRDGLLIRAIHQEEGQRSDSFAAMSATMFGAAETATTVLGKGIPNRVIAESDHRWLIAVGAGSKALIIVLVSLDAELGLLLLELGKAETKFKELFT
jgi:predicted regulator of Ras-like GTPase activity (Roadblock/LC7/MglB family)